MSLNAKVKNGYAYFNAIPEKMIFEAKDKEGHLVTDKNGKQVYNVLLNVPQEYSRKGVVTVSTSYLNDDKFEEGTKDISFKEDYKMNVRVYSYYNQEKPEDNKFKDVEVTAGELAGKVQEYADAKKAKEEAAKTEAEAEAEDERDDR